MVGGRGKIVRSAPYPRADFRIPFRPPDRLGLPHRDRKIHKKTVEARGSVLNGQAVPAQRSHARASEGGRRRIWTCFWVTLLLAILGFLVIYPVLTLLLGALTDTNPVVDGFSLRHLSIANFLAVLANPNVAEALVNTLIVCGGGT